MNTKKEWVETSELYDGELSEQEKRYLVQSLGYWFAYEGCEAIRLEGSGAFYVAKLFLSIEGGCGIHPRDLHELLRLLFEAEQVEVEGCTVLYWPSLKIEE